MLGQLVGLLASIAVYLTGEWLFLRMQALRIRALPSEWREHPELRDGYDAALDRSLRSVFASMPKRATRAWLAWLAVFVVWFAVVAAAHVTLAFELLYIAALALMWTTGEYQRSRAEVERLRDEHGLPRLPDEPWGRLRRVARWTPWLLLWLGYLGTAGFAGGLLALPIT